MSSYTASIRDAIATALNSVDAQAEFSQPFQAEAVWTPEKKLESITGLIVQVFAVAAERTQETRRSVRKDIQVNILIGKRIQATTDATDPDKIDEVDAMMQLGEEVADYVALRGPYAGSPCLRVEVDPILDFEQLRTNRVFVSAYRAFLMRCP